MDLGFGSSPLTRAGWEGWNLAPTPWLLFGTPWPMARPSSSRGRAIGGALEVRASYAVMRDVRLVMDLLSSMENCSALLLQVLMVSTLDERSSCPTCRAFTSLITRSSFSSAVVILDVRVGGFFPRWRALGEIGGEWSGEDGCWAIRAEEVAVARIDLTGRRSHRDD